MISPIKDVDGLAQGNICIIGMPFDHQSSYRPGCAMAPARIREAFFSPSANLWTETGLNLGDMRHLKDLGDMPASCDSGVNPAITTLVEQVLDRQARPVVLGGDHAVTYPIMQAVGKRYENLTILHLDAHPDLYDELGGNRLSHACPFARIMEENLAAGLVQIGIRTINGHQREQASKYGVTVYDMCQGNQWENRLNFNGPVYLSLDLDCLDPAFAPGVSHYEPGGMTTREVIRVIHQIRGNLVGADIVEYNPDRDYLSLTAMVASKLLREILGHMIVNA